MFTGLVTDIGEVVRCDGGALSLTTSFALSASDVGASICCDGCCLTATAIRAESGQTVFDVDVSNETLSCTTLGSWRLGRRVNLERSLKVSDELGGHIVSGHVDGIGTVVSIAEDGDSRRFTFEADKALLRFIAEKGSIAVDGTSLTVNAVTADSFAVNLIPHTLTNTTWGRKKQGDQVNIEVDIFARYVARLMEFQQ
jgi:riboflavin synthase